MREHILNFKAMVLHLIGIGDKSTPKTVEISFTKLLTMFAIAPVIPIIGITSVIGIATGLLLGNKFYGLLPANALPPLLVLTKQILKKILLTNKIVTLYLSTLTN